jgi:serine/threonine protein kinase
MLKEISIEASETETRPTKVINLPIKVVSGLGRGGYSVVLKAQNTETGEYFALKVISKERTTRKKDQDRLRRELKLMTELDSRFLQKCHKCFESNQDLFFLLDFIDGGDLFYHLSKRQEVMRKAFTEFEVKILLSEVTMPRVCLFCFWERIFHTNSLSFISNKCSLIHSFTPKYVIVDIPWPRSFT